jgi:hypothetical protein
MLEDAAAWTNKDMNGHMYSIAQSPVYSFVVSHFPGQYLKLTLKAIAAHYHQLYLGRSAVCGGVELPADHQNLPELSTGRNFSNSTCDFMLQLLVSGLTMHYIMIPAGRYYNNMAHVGEMLLLKNLLSHQPKM